MSRARSRFTQADIAKAVKAAIAAGLEIARVQIAADGTITIVTGKSAEQQQGHQCNEWDRVLDDGTDQTTVR
jgi:hypothetical protein